MILINHDIKLKNKIFYYLKTLLVITASVSSGLTINFPPQASQIPSFFVNKGAISYPSL